MVEVVSGVEMSVGSGGADNGGDAVANSGDFGVAGGGAG